jgi:hypothetical protein
VLKGQELLFGLNGATWGYDGLAWLKAASAVSPPARGGEGLAWNTLNLTNPQILLFGGHATASGTKLNDTWVWLTPSIGLTPQSVSITKSGSSYIVTMNLQDTGNVPDGTIAVTSATLSAAVAKSASTISLLNPGAAGSVTAKFPASSVGGISGVPVPVTFAGTYSANGVSGNQWVGTFVVILP